MDAEVCSGFFISSLWLGAALNREKRYTRSGSKSVHGSAHLHFKGYITATERS
jgi:hypothetical protein